MNSGKNSVSVSGAANGERWAVFLDLDGTLFAEKHVIPQENLDAIRAVRDKGHLVFLNTGRSLANIPPAVTETVPLDGVIAGNGAMIILGNEILQDAHMPFDLLQRVGTYLFSHRERWALMEGKHRTYAIVGETAQRIPGKIYLERPEDLEMLRDDHIQVIAVGDVAPPDFARLFAKELTVIQCPGFADVTMKGIHKGVGIQKVLAATGIRRANTIAMGDSGNDRTMLQCAGIGIAMANAQPELLAIADDITASNLDCGVAHALRKYLL